MQVSLWYANNYRRAVVGGEGGVEGEVRVSAEAGSQRYRSAEGKHLRGMFVDHGTSCGI